MTIFDNKYYNYNKLGTSPKFDFYKSRNTPNYAFLQNFKLKFYIVTHTSKNLKNDNDKNIIFS